MHELSLCHALVRQASRVAAAHGAARITRLCVRIGPLAGVEASLLAEAFPIASRATPADGARLELLPCPVRVHCPLCTREGEATANDLRCPHCGHWRTRLLSGDALLLDSVDLAAEAPPDSVQEPAHVR